MKRIAILGSTGSIGTQTLNVVRRHPDDFSVEVLCAGNNAELLIQQALEFDPNTVVIANKALYTQVQEALSTTDIKVFAGEESICDVMEMGSIDIVVAAIVGFAGLRPTMRAIEHGKTIALANKETMVVAGEIVTRTAFEHHTPILPVDSEHSAIFQCLEPGVAIDKILLTASGGPFFGKNRSELQHVSLDQALNHPNWKMGRKVTIDSASLMNKGLEVIEAKWLFGVNVDQIEVLVHPQSVVHSMVQYADGSIKAQIGTATMETPIQYALTYPNRIESHLPRFSFLDHPQLTFHRPDTSTFRCLDLAYQAIRKGGNMPCIMNAANEVAVQRFIDGKIQFLEIADFVETAMNRSLFIAQPTLDDLFATDSEVRGCCATQ
ncbi:MAG: 1-deoxy-D-xylulose-5-phosphate reductoisomerase [Bacteroidales bacterium]|nr:1-deoxy-D-xylulose-5-phosphate reductoisomerase [Bacteroidales bacterium]